MKVIGKTKNEKTYLEEIKCLKKLCRKAYGIGFYFTNAKIRAALIETMNDFINDLAKGKQENE